MPRAGSSRKYKMWEQVDKMRERKEKFGVCQACDGPLGPIFHLFAFSGTHYKICKVCQATTRIDIERGIHRMEVANAGP